MQTHSRQLQAMKSSTERGVHQPTKSLAKSSF